MHLFNIRPHRNDKLRKMNAVYKEQLDEAHNTNESLTRDLEKLTTDWTHLREEMDMKEKDWVEEEQVKLTLRSLEVNTYVIKKSAW